MFTNLKEAPKPEEIYLNSGMVYRIKNDPATGFWHIQSDNGILPSVLSGRYTSKSAVREDILRYINNAKSGVKIVEERITLPTLFTKDDAKAERAQKAKEEKIEKLYGSKELVNVS
jgi:hypothetical protein